MAIDTNALTLGSSLPAKSSFQTRASGTSGSQVGNDQNPEAEPGAQTSSSAAAPAGPTAAADSSNDSPSQTASAAQKNVGPSAQTRANTRTLRMPVAVSAAATTAAGAGSAAAAQDANADFGTVMATALGRSAATTAVPAAPAKAASDTANSTTPAPPAASTPGDAVAWIAQALMPSVAAAQTSATAAGAADIDASDATPGAAIQPGSPGNAVATTAELATAAATGALHKQITDESLSPPRSTQIQEVGNPTNQATPAQLTATTQGSVNAMADVQKLILGLSTTAAADGGTDSADDIAGAPVAHAATTAGAADDSQSATALQAAGLTRSDSAFGNATLTIQAPVSSAAFADEVGARVTGLAQSGITQAQLQLSPADLGPVQVHITLQSGQASVWFGAAHPDTRAALEQSLPRLRELFAGAGMPLTDSGVFREPPQQQQAQALPAGGSSRTAGSEALSTPTVTQVSNIRLSLLDTYA